MVVLCSRSEHEHFCCTSRALLDGLGEVLYLMQMSRITRSNRDGKQPPQVPER
jgi:hypothetical protein